jgi:aspartyl-tRNA(Asn)/glutamyl-tRNA(Gln) amidotransferase subunit B
LRVDANVSARLRGATKLGTKTEVKNMNSFSAVERALELEFERQRSVLESGGSVEQQTFLWDGGRGTVRPSRTKEGSDDYRYFPEPDLLPLVLDEAWVAKIRKELPELPDNRRTRFAKEFGLTMTEAEQVTVSPELAEYFEATARAAGDGRAAYNWVMGEVMAARVSATFAVRPADLAQLIDLVKQGTVSHTAAKTIFGLMVETGKPPAQIVADEGLVKVDDAAALEGWVAEVLKENPSEAQRFLAGEKKLQGVLVGLVMKKSKGRADPKRVNQLLASRAG